jgi:error-prone DNA polymerase
MPDIDLDLPSGDQRERVIQYVYQRYGARGAGMTANVVTYRGRPRRATSARLGLRRSTGKLLLWSRRGVGAIPTILRSGNSSRPASI